MQSLKATVTSKLHSLATLQAPGAPARPEPGLEVTSKLHSLATLQEDAVHHGPKYPSQLHPSFTAWLRCRSRSRLRRSGGYAKTVTSKLHSLATLQVYTPLGSLIAHLGYIQASQLGYVAGPPERGTAPRRRTGYIQASQLGYVAGPRACEGSTYSAPVTSKLHSLATLQVLDLSDVERAIERYIQASQLGYVAGSVGLGLRSAHELLHPSFTAWLRCRWHSLTELDPPMRLHPSFTAWLRCRKAGENSEERR